VAVDTAQGLEWTHVPGVFVRSRSDDNYRLTPENERPVSYSQLNVGAEIAARDDGFRFDLAPRINSINYDDVREPDRDDLYADMRLAVNDERHEWAFGGSYAREGTLTTAFEDTGFTETDVDRTRTNLTTNWNALVTEKAQYALEFAREDVRFEDAFLSPLVDYHYDSLSGNWVRALSDRASVEVNAFAATLTYETANPDTDTAGFGAAWVLQVSPSLHARLGAGVYRTDGGGLAEPSQDRTVDMALGKRWQRWSLDALVASGAQPSAYGVLERFERVELDSRRRLSAKLDVGVRLRAERRTAEGESLDYTDRRFGWASAYVDWRFAEQWTFSANIDARSQEYADEPRARGLAGAVTVAYRGRRK
jgi:hypothetical protein